MDAPKPTTEEQILAAAQAVFLEKGWGGARMQEIADRAGINKALLHYYFRSKDKLFEVILTRAIGTLMPRLLAVLEADLDLFEKIRRFTHEYVGFVSHNSFLPLFIVNEINRNPAFFFGELVRRERPMIDGFRRQIEAAVAAGQIRPITADELLMNLLSMVIFPFLARPMLKIVLELDEAAFQMEMTRRRTAIAEFIIQSLRP